MSRKPNIPAVEFTERRSGHDRRQSSERRSCNERRADFRSSSMHEGRRTIRFWFKSLTNTRLGVDRRKHERRTMIDRRQNDMQALLSREELSDLLGPL